VAPERGVPYEVPKLEYVEVDRRRLPYGWGDQIPITHCIRCGCYMDDPTRDALGEPMPDHFFGSEEDREAVCTNCRLSDLGATLHEEIVEIIDETLGGGEVDPKAIRGFIETVFTDPKKILKVQELENRVSGLERQNTALWVAFTAVLALLAILIAVFIAVS
jgi:hypothetical protein